jgi:hypothetical protein
MIPPAKMAAFTGGMRKEETGGKMKGKGAPGKVPPVGKGKSSADKPEPVDFETYETGKYKELAPLLEQSATAIEESAAGSGLDASVLHGQDTDQDVIDLITDDFDTLPDDLQESMQVLSDASLEDIKALGTYIGSTGLVDDTDLVTSWLFVAAKEVLGNDELSSNEQEEEEEGEGEEEEFEEEEGEEDSGE